MATHIWVITAFFEAPRKLFTFRFCLILEEQFDLPARFINVSNSARGQCKVVGQKGVVDARIGVFVANTPACCRQDEA